jgi:hypothetical protein
LELINPGALKSSCQPCLLDLRVYRDTITDYMNIYIYIYYTQWCIKGGRLTSQEEKKNDLLRGTDKVNINLHHVVINNFSFVFIIIIEQYNY